MKKKLLYFLIFLLIIFIIPAICTKTSKSISEVEEPQKESAKEEKKSYDYSNYSTIKLYHTKTKEVEEIPLDEYIYGTVSAEMPANFELEALKAQAVVSRTYTLYQIINGNKDHDGAEVCDDSNCCQAWISKEDRLAKWTENKEEKWNKIEECVNETKGKIITYNNEPINAFFHSNSGGKTELPVDVWGGGSNMPYLQVVETSGEDGYTQYNSEVELTNEEIVEKLKEKYSDIQIDFNNDEDIKIVEYTSSERVKTIKFGNHEISGTEARSIFGLKSTNFEVEKEEGKIKFTVKGYGHGVGMSQTGADSMAKSDSSAEEIIKHFYVGVEIKDVNEL